jgi:ADP-heptose:LPS heptosyltransferase
VLLYDRHTESSLALINKIRSKKYNAVIDLYCNPRTALVTRLSGVKYRIGFPFRGRAYAYNIPITPRSGKVHNVDFNLDVLRHFDIPINSSTPILPLTEDAKQFAENWIQKEHMNSNIIIGIYPSGGWATKKWKLESFAKLADRFIEEEKSTVVIFWGPGEERDIREMEQMMKNKCHKIPKTSLMEMSAIINRCSYFIANDSGPMHIAAALNVPTLGIFGPTNPYLQGPVGNINEWVRCDGLDCLQCNLTSCPIGLLCMNILSVESVYSKFLELAEKVQQFHGKEKN